MSLLEKLANYSDSDPVRFHMPGHKGRMPEFDPYKFDVTEILDFDDLHNPKGEILKLNRRLSKFYGVADARLLVNGTTSGIMAAIFSMLSPNEKVLMPKSCHKSVYNGLILKRANPVFIDQKIGEYGILSPLNPEDIEKKLNENPDIKLGIITYPTYEGVIFDIKDIISRFHRRNIPVLVDAAHGAHLTNSDFLSADISVVSLHKSLPFFTQTSCMLFSPDGMSFLDKSDYYLSCFESSSPSYVLMAGAELGLNLLEDQKDELYKKLDDNLTQFYKRAKALKNIEIINHENTDKTKIVIASKKSGAINTIEEELTKANIIPEMTTTGYILCMASIMNNSSDFNKLFEVLEETDKKICLYKDKEYIFPQITGGTYKYKIYEAKEMNGKSIDFEDAQGEASTGFVEMFPPGIPFIIPGQVIEKNHIELVKNAKANKINIRGLNNNKITVV